MHSCDYCNKELTNRKVFCSNSHRVMYHKKGKAFVPKPPTEKQPIEKKKHFSKLLGRYKHTSELQSHSDLVCRLMLEKKKNKQKKKKNNLVNNNHQYK